MTSLMVGNHSNNSRGGATSLSGHLMQPLWMRLIIMACYAVIGCLGIAGNAMVAFVVLRKRTMQTITNLFITNLAISDIIMSTVNVPLTPAAIFMDSWTLPSALCKLMPMTMGVTVYVSTLTSTAIAMDRYFVIVHPFVPRMRPGLCGLVVAVVCIVAILISAPIAVFQKTKTSDDHSRVSCVEDWKSEYRAVFTVISFVLQFLVPCSVITVCYARVSASLSRRHRSHVAAARRSRLKEAIDIKRKRRTNRMLIAMVGIFVLSWIPLNLLWIAKDTNLVEDSSFQCLFFVCHVLAMSSVMYNPFLYGWMNANFQCEFRSLLPSGCCRCLSAASTNIGQARQPAVAAAVEAADADELDASPVTPLAARHLSDELLEALPLSHMQPLSMLSDIERSEQASSKDAL